MELSVLTLFPEIVSGALGQSIMKRAIENRLISLELVNIRDFSTDRHKTVDDVSYGGGPGMVMKPEPVYKAVKSVQRPESRIILMTPAGQRFNQKIAGELAQESHLIFICGHYEGIDERVTLLFNPLCLSIGDYVITNGALAASVVIDAVTRFIPGVLGNSESAALESFSEGLVEYPQYTKPRNFMGHEVPEVLLSGNHKAIEKWRREEALKRTRMILKEDLAKEENHA